MDNRSFRRDPSRQLAGFFCGSVGNAELLARADEVIE
jgi:hypothetical protein